MWVLFRTSSIVVYDLSKPERPGGLVHEIEGHFAFWRAGGGVTVHIGGNGGTCRSVSARRSGREHQADRVLIARRQVRRFQDRYQAHRERQVVSLHGALV